MNYPPKEHQETNIQHVMTVIKNYPLATVISVSNHEPVITHIPLILQNNELIGHLDANNPHTELLKNQNKVTIIFSAPQCYISPSIYSSKQLPTWNYVKVHIEGTVTEITEPNIIKQSMVDMTAFLESPEHKFQLDYQDPRMEKYLPYIKGFKVVITNWEGKFKLSQNKSIEDFNRAKTEMIKRNQVDITSFLNEIIQ
ncbi:MAG: transcriptional regulator [Flavobacteriaceae bacterium]|uniref:FMN-binding negative transcriptional regulator n=1 Tax=Bizionia echini TaxID=649333 RepID=UPI000C8DF8BC|nr:transcriptional regulator [Flavobacteriaceae bacterium]